MLHTAAHHALVRNIIAAALIGAFFLLATAALCAGGIAGSIDSLVRETPETWFFVVLAVIGAGGLWVTARSGWSELRSYIARLRLAPDLFAVQVQRRINRYIGDTLNERLAAGAEPSLLQQVLCHAPLVGLHTLTALHPGVSPQQQLRHAL